MSAGPDGKDGLLQDGPRRPVLWLLLPSHHRQPHIAAQNAVARQAHRHDGAGADIAFHIQQAAMELHHGLGERDAQAGAFMPAGPGIVHLAEGGEDLGHVLRRDADAGVGDADMHVAAVVCMALLAQVARLGPLYLIGVFLVAVLLIYEQSLVSRDDLSQVKRAFDLNGYVGILYFATTAAAVFIR